MTRRAPGPDGRGGGGARAERAQAELTGTMLLVGVVTLVIAVGGGLVVTGYFDNAGDDQPVSLDAEVDASEVRLHHAGGRALSTADVSVIVRQDGSETRSSLSTWTHEPADDGRFGPADRANRSHGFGTGTIRVVVVHLPSESVLLDETFEASDNSPPSASFTYTCGGLSCSFDASGSSDPDGPIASYDWTFGDGDAGTGETPSHDYDADGTYTVELVVTDADGVTDATTRQVTVDAYEPTISGVQVVDRTADGGADFRVNYEVTNTTYFDRVDVEFDNQANDWSDATATNTSARGYVTYSEDGTGGNEYNVTVRAYNLSGSMTDSVSITKIANGTDSGDGNISNPTGLAFAGTVVDDTSATQASYEVSYNVTNRSEFGRVEVEVANLDQGSATETYTSTDPRTNLDDYSASTWGDSYRVTLELLDDSGVVVDEVEVTDVADGTDPAGNDDLSRPGSPTLSNWVVQDRSTSSAGARYNVTYAATDTAEFAGVETIFRNRDQRDASGTASATSPSGTLTYQPGYAYGDQYEVEVRVLDADGVVVDEYTVSDVADGTDPGGNEPPSSPSSPALAGVAVDDTSVSQASYEVSYNVTNRQEFDRVEVEVENLDSAHATASYTSTDPRDNVDDYAESTYGENYRITVSVIDDVGFVVDEVVVTDTADGTDPAGNDDLSRPGSPTLSSYTVTDASSSWAAEYQVQYAVTSTAEFAGVELVFRNRDDQYASEATALQTSPSGSYTHAPDYSAGSQYEIEIRVVDTDGIVVDEVVVTDTADGTDP